MGEVELRREYYRVADEAVEYIALCARKGIVPLMHDARIFRTRLNKARVTGRRTR